MTIHDILTSLHVDVETIQGNDLEVHSPIDGTLLASLQTMTNEQVDQAITKAEEAFRYWQYVPAPKRGDLVRIFGNVLRKHKDQLGLLVTYEAGKILTEGQGEVQEMIDMCDYAVGLSRMIGGKTVPSERATHVMEENWQPLGPIGVITAFNFPVAVWAWNTAIALICGDPIIWKPSHVTPLTALACQALLDIACKEYEQETGTSLPEGLSQVIIGSTGTGEQMVNDHRLKLISATGSCRMGIQVGPQVAVRFGRSLLELGGNNAAIVTPTADLDNALQSIIFGSVGTTGQRCTSTRRLFVHSSLYESFWQTLVQNYNKLPSVIGDPREEKTLVGPLIHEQAFNDMQSVLAELKNQGNEVVYGERVLAETFPDGYYVKPALVKTSVQNDLVKQETFAPILYVMPYENLSDALVMLNDVPQGLSSCIFTNDIKEAEYFKSHSYCGIANVNIGTSGAEIGGAFGGEKETGGGREAGSDAWKAYMRRVTSTTYYGETPPALAQGVSFSLE